MVEADFQRDIEETELLLYRRILQFIGNSSSFDKNGFITNLYLKNFEHLCAIPDKKCIIYMLMTINNLINKIQELDNFNHLKEVMDFVFKNWEDSEWA